MLVSATFFGWPFAIFKLAAAAVMGIVGGVWIDRKPIEAATIDDSISPSPAPHTDEQRRCWSRLLPHAIDMLRSIWVWLVIGIFVSAAINQFNTAPLTAEINHWGLLPAMLLVLVFSIPLYVCATASVPIAAALVNSGFPPAVALVFLMAGPATNVATMGAIRSNLGTRSLLIYLVTIIVGSLSAAYLFDALTLVTTATGTVHIHNVTAWWAQLSAMIVLGLIGYFVFENLIKCRRFKAPQENALHQTISIDGMSCGNCVRKLETLIQNQTGVESVYVNLADGQATVVGDFDLEQLKKTITASGFVPH